MKLIITEVENYINISYKKDNKFFFIMAFKTLEYLRLDLNLTQNNIEEFKKNKRLELDTNINCKIDKTNIAVNIEINCKDVRIGYIYLKNNKLFFKTFLKEINSYNFEEINNFVYDNFGFKIGKSLIDEFYSINILNKFC